MRNDVKKRGRRLKAAQKMAIKHLDTDSAAVVNEIAILLDEWTEGPYKFGDLRQYNGIPCRCVQPHDSTGNPTWTPDDASLWTEYHGTSIDTARPYKAPQGAHDAYQIDEYVIWTDSAIYRCKKDNTVYDPATLPGSWEKVQGTTQTEPEPEEPAGDEWPQWVQPTGGHDAYAQGAKVSHKGKHWTSNVGANVWEPGVAMWTEAA